MMDAIKRMGVSYGRLGLSTAPEIIEARAQGAQTAAEALKASDVPDLVRSALGLKISKPLTDFLTHFNDVDPAFDLQSTDHETSILAATVLGYEMERERKLSGVVALVLVTASLGKIRSPETDDSLLDLAEKTLTHMQAKVTAAPADRTYSKQPPEFLASIETLKGLTAQQQASTTTPHVLAALREVAGYAENIALNSARNDNFVLAYVRKLEEEARIQWWVMGGWCSDMGAPYRTLSIEDAAVRAGKDLADRHTNNLGIFSAPALLENVIAHGRAEHSGKMPLTESVLASDRGWRSKMFGDVSASSLADLIPVSAALGLAALSDDAPDWQPRFKRMTLIDPTIELTPFDLALQVYRERLTMRALAD